MKYIKLFENKEEIKKFTKIIGLLDIEFYCSKFKQFNIDFSCYELLHKESGKFIRVLCFIYVKEKDLDAFNMYGFEQRFFNGWSPFNPDRGMKFYNEIWYSYDIGEKFDINLYVDAKKYNL